MLLQKIKILIIIFLLPLFNLNEKETLRNSVNSFNNYKIKIDSLNTLIKNSGWNNNLKDAYHFFLINSGKSIEEKLKDLPEDYQLSFLKALLLKKEENYNDMFEILYNSFSEKINYLPYFEELLFAASASDKINLVEERINKSEFPQKNFIKGLIYYARGEYENSIKEFEAALKKNNDKNIFYKLSYAYRNSGNYEKAGEILRKASELFSDDKWFITKTRIAEGSLYFLSGDYDNALKLYEEGLKSSVENSDLQNEAKAYINIGIIKDIAGNIEESHNYFNKAIAVTTSIDDYENLAIAYSELGVSYTFINQLPEAKLNYLKCLSLFEKMNNRHRLAVLHNNLGKIYMTLFDYESAFYHYEKSLEYSGDDKRSAALNLTGIADVYANLSNYTKAIHYYRQAQEISSEIKELSLNADINSGLGSLNFNLNRFDKAIQYYSSAKVFAEESGNPYQLTDLNHKIAVSYLELDSLDKSETFFYAALNLAKEKSIPYYEALLQTELAELYRKKKDFNKALKNIRSAEKTAANYSFNYLLARGKMIEGEINSEAGKFQEAERLFKSALGISQKLNEFNLQSEAYYHLARLFENNGFKETAESYYKSAVALIEDVSRPLFSENEVQISYFSGNKDLYDSFASFYLTEKKYKEAFELIDKSLSRNTVQNLTNLKLQVLLDDKNTLDKIYEYEWIIHSGIYNEDKVNRTKAEYSLLKDKIISEYPQLKRYLNKENHFNVEDIQDNLGNEEYFISFYLNEKTSHAFLISKNNFKHFEINAGRDELIKLRNNISPYFINDPSQNTFYNQDLFSFNAKAANEFYNVLLKDLLNEVPEKAKIIISSPADLVSLPFDFLVVNFDEGESAYSYSDKDYLIYHYNISYTPSASVFVHQKQNKLKAGDNILIAGNPEINNQNDQYAERRGLLEGSTGLPRNVSMLPLKYSGEEINSISSLINADKILTDNDATETGFKENAELSKIIHLSTHSFLFNKQPVIFFSNNNDEKNDGFLEAGEIVQLKLNSELVVLSSCNSGLGNIDASEVIIGMTKAFFEAGSKSVVVSLWEVNDKFTSKLMTLLYQKLSEGYDKDEAMRLAKIDFIKNYSPNPYFWSAFILSGNTESIELKSKPEISIFLAGLSVILLAAVIFFVRRRTKNISSNPGGFSSS